MADWNLMIGDERELVGIRERSLHIYPVDRIDPVQNDESDIVSGSFFHGQSHGRDVSVEASADVLNIEDERVDPFEHFSSRLPHLSIETVNRQAGLFVLRITDLLMVKRAADA